MGVLVNMWNSLHYPEFGSSSTFGSLRKGRFFGVRESLLDRIRAGQRGRGSGAVTAGDCSKLTRWSRGRHPCGRRGAEDAFKPPLALFKTFGGFLACFRRVRDQMGGCCGPQTLLASSKEARRLHIPGSRTPTPLVTHAPQNGERRETLQA